MQLVRRGDSEAFEVVYERHATAAFSLAYRIVGTRNVAEDVVQEAFLSLWRSGARYDRARGSVRTWVLGIVHNRAIDALRRSMVHDRRRASDEGIEERFEARERTEVEVARNDEAREVHAALRALPGRAVQGDRACLLRRVQPVRDRRHARDADRHGEGANAARPGEDARPARRSGGGMDMSGCDHGIDAGAWVLGALDEREAAAYEQHLRTCEELPRGGRTAAGPCRRAGARHRADPAAAGPQGPDHGRDRGRSAGAPARAAPRERRWFLRPLPVAGLVAATLAVGVAVGTLVSGRLDAHDPGAGRDARRERNGSRDRRPRAARGQRHAQPAERPCLRGVGQRGNERARARRGAVHRA